jgi:hypothetical protein
MLLKILLVGALTAAVMAAAKDGRLLRHVGLLSSCTPVAASGPDQTLQRCRKGRLDGYPDLSNKSCEAIDFVGADEYWRCLAPIVASQSPRG